MQGGGGTYHVTLGCSSHVISSRMAVKILLVCVISAYLCFAFGDLDNLSVKSQGTPWPMPKEMKQSDDILVLDKNKFDFKFTSLSCDLLYAAVKRYHGIIFDEANTAMLWYSQSSLLSQLEIELKSPCEEYPHFGMDESCT